MVDGERERGGGRGGAVARAGRVKRRPPAAPDTRSVARHTNGRSPATLSHARAHYSTKLSPTISLWSYTNSLILEV